LRDKGFDVLWHPLSAYPAFAISDQNPLAELMVALTGQQTVAAVSYGTEAGLFQQAGIDAIICGPGNISRAHRPNEYIELAEMQACKQMIEGLAAHLVS
jgi:acetylornithine deacetylase